MLTQNVAPPMLSDNAMMSLSQIIILGCHRYVSFIYIFGLGGCSEGSLSTNPNKEVLVCWRLSAHLCLKYTYTSHYYTM